MMIVVMLAAIGFAALLQFAAGEPWSSALLVLSLALLSAAALRVTARQLTIAVAIVLLVAATAFVAMVLLERSQDYRSLATLHAREIAINTSSAAYCSRAAQKAREVIEAVERGEMPVRPMVPVPANKFEHFKAEVLRVNRAAAVKEVENAAWHQALVAYHAGLLRKYQRAASRPWLTVPFDPPSPPKP
jgi:hypothetical protein